MRVVFFSRGWKLQFNISSLFSPHLLRFLCECAENIRMSCQAILISPQETIFFERVVDVKWKIYKPASSSERNRSWQQLSNPWVGRSVEVSSISNVVKPSPLISNNSALSSPVRCKPYGEKVVKSTGLLLKVSSFKTPYCCRSAAIFFSNQTCLMKRVSLFLASLLQTTFRSNRSVAMLYCWQYGRFKTLYIVYFTDGMINFQ